MSTKIYYGFRLKARTMRQALDDLESASTEVNAVLEKRKITFLAKTATAAIDAAAVSKLLPAKEAKVCSNPLSAAWGELLDRQAEVRKTMRRDPVVDFEVIFRLWLCRKTKAFIGYIRGEGAGEFLTILTRSGLATDFGYWNNTDGPANLNPRQWKKRGDIWRDLLDDKSGPWFDVYVPEKLGFSDAVDVAAAQPSFERRVHALAADLAISRWLTTQKVTRPDLDPLKAYREFLSKTRHGDESVKALWQTATEELSALLPPVITKEMLLGEVPLGATPA